MQNIQDLITTQIGWRYAVKEFVKGKKADSAKIAEILEAGRMAPAAYGLQPFKIIHVTTESVREDLKVAAFGQPKVTDAGDFYVVAVRTDIDDNFVDEYIQNIASIRGVQVEYLKGFEANMKGDLGSRGEANKFAWAGRQAYISLGFMLETAALLEVDVCPMEGFNPIKFDEILGLSDLKLRSVGAFAIGYRDESDTYATLKKVRISKEDFLIQK